MSQASSQAWAFYREVATTRTVWTVTDAGGYPSPVTSSGRRAFPLWSSRSRVERIIATVPVYAGFEPDEMQWTFFCDEWIPDLVRDGYLVGVNWSGQKASGYDLEPEELRRNVEAVIENPR